MHSPRIYSLTTAALLGFAAATPAMAHHSEIEAQLQKAEQRIAELERSQQSDWLNERRAEEVKGLIRDVLADADTRATLLQDGILAGHDGKGFFLKSADGSFKMNLAGYIQFGYNIDRNENNSNKTQHAFQMNRAKLYITGTAQDIFGYRFCLATNRNTGNVYMEEAQVSMKYDDASEFYAGVNFAPFLREAMMASSRLLAVDRAQVTRAFDPGFSTQLGIKHQFSDNVKLNASLSNGLYNDTWGYTEFGRNSADIAGTARVDVKLAGDWKQANDYVAWLGNESAAFVGAAMHAERSDRDSSHDRDLLFWTLDSLIKSQQWTASLAVTGLHVFEDDSSDLNHYAANAQLAYNFDDHLQPYLRYEWADIDNAEDTWQIITAGANYYFNKHQAKLTTDVVWAFEGNSSDDNDQFTLRGQFQLAF